MIYKLNLPQLSECILEGIAEKYLFDNNENSYAWVEPKKIFKSEYLHIKDLNWTEVLIFFKKNSKPGIPHTDNSDPNKITTWGINWIYNGIGLMEYWNFDDFPKENVKFVLDKHGYGTYHCLPAIPPRSKYILKPGAYLVNTSMVHSAIGNPGRYCVSYRTTGRSFSWGEIVNLFDDLIDKDTRFTT